MSCSGDLMRAACSGDECDKDIQTNVLAWLKQNRLNQFINYFQENGLIMDDLLTYDEADMDSVIEDCKISAYAYKKKFKDAIRKLQFEATKNMSLSFSEHINKIHRVVISSKESDAITKLQVKLKDINITLYTIKEATEELLQDTDKIDKQIEKTFETFRNKLNEREKLLKSELKTVSDKHLSNLKEQQNNLTGFEISIKNALNEQNTLILDPTLNITKRERDIIQITNTILAEINDEYMLIEDYKLHFSVDEDDILECMLSMGTIASGGVQFLRFSDKFKSVDGLILSDDRKTVKCTATGHKYILADIEPLFKGKHCWRIQVNKNKYWLFIGVAEQKIHTDKSYHSSYGCSGSNQYYKLHSVSHNSVDTSWIHTAQFIDIFLDIDEGKLNICEVGRCLSNTEAKFWGLPNTHNYVPSFNIYGLNIELRLARIPTSWYGKTKSIKFE